MVRFASLRTILAMVTEMNLEFDQINIETAFLHGKLKENFMDLVKGFVSEGQEKKVRKLKSSIYELNQSSR